MWEEQKQRRFQSLRQREFDGVLTEGEHAELSQMVAEIEAAEAISLRPATERLRAEREQTEAQNRALDVLVLRKEALVNRLHTVLDELETDIGGFESNPFGV